MRINDHNLLDEKEISVRYCFYDKSKTTERKIASATSLWRRSHSGAKTRKSEKLERAFAASAAAGCVNNRASGTDTLWDQLEKSFV